MVKYISVVDTAKLIRQELKENFPNIKFSVKSKSYSMGASIDINYTGNVTVAKIENITDKFKGSTFDGMIDLKSYVTTEYNGESVHFASDHVFVRRNFSVHELECFAEYISENYNFVNLNGGNEKPVYEVKENEYYTHIDVKNNVMFGSRYFEQYVMSVMHEYDSFEDFLKQEDIETYKRLYGQVIKDKANEIKEVINNTINKNGYKIKLDRNWTWVSGVTKEDVKTQDALRLLGFRWSNKRKAWYYGFDAVNQVKEVLGIE